MAVFQNLHDAGLALAGFLRRRLDPGGARDQAPAITFRKKSASASACASKLKSSR